jgi:hypothetical protein
MKIKVGTEIDAYCTKCKLVLGHVVVAMTGDKPKKVECLTCHGQHMYKASAPKSRKKADSKKASSTSNAKKPKAKKRSKSELIQEKEKKLWEETLAKKDLALAKPYSMAGSYEFDDVINHGKFGMGIVTNIVNTQKMEVLFEDGYKSMVCNFSK